MTTSDLLAVGEDGTAKTASHEFLGYASYFRREPGTIRISTTGDAESSEDGGSDEMYFWIYRLANG